MKALFLGMFAITAVFTPSISHARWLKVDTGRFMTMDTFAGNQEHPKSLHLYVYCEGDPVDNIDRNGHDIAEVLSVMDIGSIFDSFSLATITKTGATVVNQRAVIIHIDVNPQNMLQSFHPPAIQQMLEPQLTAGLKIGSVPGQSLHIKIRVGGNGLNGNYGWMGQKHAAYFHLINWDPNHGVSGYTLPGTTTTTFGTTKIEQDFSAASFNPNDQYWVNSVAHEVIYHGAADLGDSFFGGQTGEIGSRVPYGLQPFTINATNRRKINQALGFN